MRRLSVLALVALFLLGVGSLGRIAYADERANGEVGREGTEITTAEQRTKGDDGTVITDNGTVVDDEGTNTNVNAVEAD